MRKKRSKKAHFSQCIFTSIIIPAKPKHPPNFLPRLQKILTVDVSMLREKDPRNWKLILLKKQGREFTVVIYDRWKNSARILKGIAVAHDYIL